MNVMNWYEELTPAQVKKARRQWYQCAHRCKDGKRKDAAGNLIEFRLTFEEWMDIWWNSGHYFERGTYHGQFVMSRFQDLGHYELGNVFIQLSTDNVSQADHSKDTTARANIKAAQNRPEVKKAKSESLMGRIHSAEHIAKISKGNKGKKRSKDECAAISQRLSENRTTCEHCGKSGNFRIMKRWHHTRCKLNVS